MAKRFSLIFALVGILSIAFVAQAGGPKTPITAQSDAGVNSATVNVTVCGAAAFPCAGQTFACPAVDIFGPDTLVKASCGPAGFKVTAFEYNISITGLGGCFGTASSGDTVPCTAGAGTVTLKVGH